jgi:hypothetical protein
MADKSIARQAADAVDKLNKMEASIPEAKAKAASKAELAIQQRMGALLAELPDDVRKAVDALR